MCNPNIHALFALVALLASGGCDRGQPPTTTNSSVGTVTMEFVLGDQTETVEIGDVATGTTLESVMRDLDKPAIALSGSGTTAFVSSIGDYQTVGNEGWTFKVDGEFAHQGIGATKLSPPTKVEWRYGDFSPP